MALPTTPTYRDILRNDLPPVLKVDEPVDLIELQCLSPTKAPKNPQCKGYIGKEHVVKIQALLNRPITYLEGDKDKIDTVLEELADRCVHPDKHGQGGRTKVKDLVEQYRKTMNQHLEAKKCEGNVMAVFEQVQVPETGLEQSLVEEEPLPVTQPSCTEDTMATKAEDVPYPALPTTHTFVIEDKEEVPTVDSSNEPHPLLHQNTTQSRPLTNPSTPLPSNPPVQLPDSITNTLPSNPLHSLIITILHQLFVGFISLVQVGWGQVLVETTSGKIEKKSVVDLQFLFGMRMATELIPVLLFIVFCGLYFQAWNILNLLAPYVLVSVFVASLYRLKCPGSKVVV